VASPRVLLIVVVAAIQVIYSNVSRMNKNRKHTTCRGRNTERLEPRPVVVVGGCHRGTPTSR
jgi:hypothetical protein